MNVQVGEEYRAYCCAVEEISSVAWQLWPGDISPRERGRRHRGALRRVPLKVLQVSALLSKNKSQTINTMAASLGVIKVNRICPVS